MGGAPVIEWIRPGVGYDPDAAASMRRLEAALGRPHDCNSSYRDYLEQLAMWEAWEAWEAGRGPKPPHSRAIHPDVSMHCRGLADDTDDWTTPGYIALAAEHGWIRTAAHDPTERHHFEYQPHRDQHRNDPTPADPEENEEMRDKYMWKRRKDGVIVNAIYNTMSGYFQPFESSNADYNTNKARGHDIAATFEVSESDWASIERACADVRGRK
jgi:hypothetical protein